MLQNWQIKTKLSKFRAMCSVLPSGKFWAYIMVNRKQISLGSHDDIEQAKAARQAAEERYGFHANHGT